MTQAEATGRDAAADAALLARLRAGDEEAFEALVTRHYATMLAVALTYVKGRSVAEEVVQEAWLGVIQGLDRFEGRSSLKTWILSILVNKAKTRGVREARTVPFTALVREGEEPAVPRERFRGPGDAFPGTGARTRTTGRRRRRPRSRTRRRCAWSSTRSPRCRSRSER
jgi:RNA polymerase sigma-70 factor (ECF subfamily)